MIVSIPKRVSEALNLKLKSQEVSRYYVSIPKRVSEALNQELLILTVVALLFQSLKGFQRL